MRSFEIERLAEEGNFAALAQINRELMLLFNREGDCLAAKLRPGNVRSAEDEEKLRLPEMDREQKQGKQVVFRAGPRGSRSARSGAVPKGELRKE